MKSNLHALGLHEAKCCGYDDQIFQV